MTQSPENTPKNTRANIIPCFAYKDPAAAITWLVKALGFTEHSRHEDNGNVAHAELAFGHGMVMIGPINTETPFGRFMTQPGMVGGLQTQPPYVIVEDADATYAAVKEAGGEIVIEIETASYGGRGFTCRDPEGFLWSVGTYDPWGEF
jgi:uncharacterized glyoxalase superfamily protein PhnB